MQETEPDSFSLMGSPPFGFGPLSCQTTSAASPPFESRPLSCRSKSTTSSLVTGHTELELPGSQGKSSFHLTTHLTSSTSLHHSLSGLTSLQHREYRELKLMMINSDQVTEWSHAQVASHLRHHLSRMSEIELTLTVQATDQLGRTHQLELSFDIIYEDGVHDTARAIYNIIVRLKDKVISVPDVTDVQFQNSRYIRIRHGAQTGYFLKEGANKTVCMAVPPCTNNDYVFKCYTFVGESKKRLSKDDDGIRLLCVLQHPCSGRYISVGVGPTALLMDEDDGFSTDINQITKPDHHFFILHSCGSGGDDDRFCLQPLILNSYYLRYDAVKGLKLEKCSRPPYQDFFVMRYYIFEFVHAEYLG